ncbi:hypothetical protein J2X31_000648 [Flavobacterium arsenatis]|uniref:T9SS C-terminal target domain-containing protein n=1 Tax=Flavobacterium arsenatis TaxID=1484332 RepID=A0ABU1TL46_9FLAO|nr:hypothetical protein [Flavobacterium arsenatis]MDR6966650.1 hypothetical protein [Flavobacterium arsenatis]
MKKSLFYFASLFLSAAVMTSCSGDDNGGTTPDPDPDPVGPVVLTGDLTTQTLTNDKQYLLRGIVYVKNAQTLTIEPGTVIMGDKATKGTLVIVPGGKIIADGTAAEPIVFTSALEPGSRDRGDWGGLILLGKAKVNQAAPSIEGLAVSPETVYGGDIDADNSGILRYVRVEFAGIELTPNNETNSITLGGVGSGTVLENAQVSFGGDDGFEWFGGSVNGKNLIAFATWDDSFDVDFGYSGKNQFGLEVRYPSFADQSGSNSFECDNGPNDNVGVGQYNFLTTGVFSNFTCIGPRAIVTQSINANYQHSLDLRRRTAVTIANSVFVGYPRGIRMNQQSVYDNYVAGEGVLTNNVMVADLQTYSVGSGMTATAADVNALWNATNTTITAVPTPEQGGLATIYTALGLNSNVFFGGNVATAYSSNPTFTVTTGTLTAGASFVNPKLAGLANTTYVGAFGSTDWTDGWAEFNPISKEY